jgi:prolipoprotein diacylglyceryltransferase
MGFTVPVVPVLAAASISYAFGEGIGRLACISFGCCYGKPLSEVHPILRHLFKERNFTFTGKTKKISYAHGLDNQEVLPIQAITSIILTLCGLLGLCCYLMGNYTVSFLVTLVITQCWRFLSEFLRADYRGGGKLSAYQLMGIGSVPYAVFIALLFGTSTAPTPKILSGLQGFWDPGVVLFLECLWLITFLFTGRSKVTGSTLSFFVVKEKI